MDFDWGTGAPVAGIGENSFSVRWTGQVRAKVTGTHTFHTTSDGGVRLFVNGTPVIRNWTDHPAADDTGTARPRGRPALRRPPRVLREHRRGGGRARLVGPGLDEEVIPSTSLHPVRRCRGASTALGAVDNRVADRLRAGGFVPVLETSATANAADANRKALVVISSTTIPPTSGAGLPRSP